MAVLFSTIFGAIASRLGLFTVGFAIKAGMLLALVVGLVALCFLTSIAAKIIAGLMVADAVACYLVFLGKIPFLKS